jgi:hypothetical protein
MPGRDEDDRNMPADGDQVALQSKAGSALTSTRLTFSQGS